MSEAEGRLGVVRSVVAEQNIEIEQLVAEIKGLRAQVERLRTRVRQLEDEAKEVQP